MKITSMWPELSVVALIVCVIGLAVMSASTKPAPVPAPTSKENGLCTRVVMLTQCTKIEKIYRHTSPPRIVSNTCVQIDDNIFCGQVAIERITEAQCKQYKDPSWSVQN